MKDISKIKAIIDPRDFYRKQGLTIERPNSIGWASGGLCPFHPDKHSGNFRVNLYTGAFKCFSCSAKGSDVIAFVMMKDNVSFKDACQRLENESRG